INHKKKGYYYVLIVETVPTNINEFQRIAGIDKEVVRTMVINTETEKRYIQSTKLSKTDMTKFKEEKKARSFDRRGSRFEESKSEKAKPPNAEDEKTEVKAEEKPAAKKTTTAKAKTEEATEKKPAAKKTTAAKAKADDAEKKPAAKKTTKKEA